MPELRIKRKENWRRLNNVAQDDWIKVAKHLGLSIVKSNRGTSHFLNIRDPKNTNLNDVRGVDRSRTILGMFKESP